jgi:sugar phosphate isomerase/epimerase
MGQLKIAYVVATPDLKINERVTALQNGLESSFRKLKEDGYDGAELMIGDPDQVDNALIRRLAREYSLEVPAYCTGEVYGQYGLSFMNPDESVRREAIEKTLKIIDYAATFGALVNVGRLRGRFSPEVPREQSLTWMYAAFERIANYAEPKGVVIILEPVAFPFCNVINSTQDGIKAVKLVGKSSFRLMLDVFSMQMEDSSMAEAFFEAKPYLKHIHLCDSNRLAPGMGIFNFDDIVTSIKRTGYEGYVSAEIYQAPDEKYAFDQTTKVLMPLVKSS